MTNISSKKIKIVFISLASILLFFLIATFIYKTHLQNRALPDYNKSIYSLKLKDSVSVYRDKHAVPHVYATSEIDLYQTVGYLTAQDRLWQMDLLRRVTQGRVSEIVGEKAIKFDLLMRSLQLDKKSNAIIEQSSDSLIQILEAYAKGVNQYIEDNKNKLPQEFTILGYDPEPWEINHSINLIGFIAWDLTPNYKAEIILEQIRRKVGDSLAMEFLPEANKDHIVFPDFKSNDSSSLSWFNILDDYTKIIDELGLTVFSASNNWAVSASKSSSGNALLANDMHLKFGLPGIWYQIHQVVENELNVTGVLLPGQPFIISGHNDSIAWGLTNLRVDNIDFFEEKISKKDSTKYHYNNSLIPLTYKKETIKFKGGEEEFLVRYTKRGPIISDWTDINASKQISMQWAGSDIFSNEVKGIWELNKAKNWNDFSKALTHFGAVSQNVNYADTKGNIGIRTCGGIPIRNKGKGSFISPGWTSDYDWKGYVPFDSLPYSYNPSSNIVASANNKTTDDTYPYYINRWFCTPYRIQRIRAFLTAKEKISIEDFKSLQNDYKSIFAEKTTATLLTILGSELLNTEEKEGLQHLKKWNYELDKNSPQALIFETFCMNFLQTVIQDELGEELFVTFSSNGAITPIMLDKLFNYNTLKLFDNIHTTETEGFNECIVKAYQKSITQLSLAYGKDIEAWKWSNKHQLVIQHPLGKVKAIDFLFKYNSPSYSVGGSFHTVSPYFYNFNEDGKVENGASHRQVYTTGDWDNSYSVIPTGTSGLSASKFYLDQTQLFINGEYHNDYFSKEKVIESAIYFMHFY